MLSRIKKKLFDIKVALFFYYFLYKRGVLREFIRACKDHNQLNNYEGVLHKLSRGVPYEYLIMQSFSFARQMYVLHSNTDWWGISHDWSHSELFKSKKSK